MWVFTKRGFFSAVCARQGDGRYAQPVDPDRIMIRARVRGHLEALQARFPAWLESCSIQESVGTDYAFRLFVDKRVWSEVLSELAADTDYDNFKGEVARHGRSDAAAYTDSLGKVWDTMRDLQP
jgi:hypothetical protein